MAAGQETRHPFCAAVPGARALSLNRSQTSPREQRCRCQVCQSVYFSLLTLVFNFLMKNANKCTVKGNKHFLVVF